MDYLLPVDLSKNEVSYYTLNSNHIGHIAKACNNLVPGRREAKAERHKMQGNARGLLSTTLEYVWVVHDILYSRPVGLYDRSRNVAWEVCTNFQLLHACGVSSPL